MMSDIFYYPYNRKTANAVENLTKIHNLSPCPTQTKNEMIYKNKKVILWKKKKYICLRALDDDMSLYNAIRQSIIAEDS